MKNYMFGLMALLAVTGCAHEHQINIGSITLQERSAVPPRHREYYMSFTQEYYDNKLYPLNQYCDDQRSYLADDKFSTETYLKITNERTKQNRVGKYPIWFLLNDDSSNISCTYKSANFINAEPFVVSSKDKLSVKLLQKNEAETSVPVQELGILIDFVSLIVPRTANFLMRANNIINDPITQNYLNLMDESFKNGDLDGTKSRDFTTKTEGIKVKLYVPQEGNNRELGYILLKPKYRTTLTTVSTQEGTPNFRFIYHSNDPRVVDLMRYELQDNKVAVKVVVDNFKQVANEHLIEALASLDTNLANRFTRYDRALVLSLALRQSDFYKKFQQAIQVKELKRVNYYMAILNQKHNPLNELIKELKVTNCDYYGLMYQAQELVKRETALQREQNAEALRIKEEALRYQIAMQGIENFLSPIANWNYLPEMFSKESEVRKTTGEVVSMQALQAKYNRESNVSAYGCYVDLQRETHGMSVQDYLIHPNYSRGEKYNYMALSVDKQNQIDIVFYKLKSNKSRLKIDKMLISSGNRFISKQRVKEVIETMQARSCSSNIRRLF
jgi:hypothetical protein